MLERAPWLDTLAITCECGLNVTLAGDHHVCSCGRTLGNWDGLKTVLGKPTGYWGEIGAEEMHRLLDHCEPDGWRKSVQEHTLPALSNYVATPDRAAFQHILPLPENSLILDLGAGMGGISSELAKKFRVVALEGVAERAQFIAIRARQDELTHNLAVINGDVNSVRFAPGQFDAAVVSGLLEWVGLFDLSGPVEEVQIQFMQSLRRLLKPGGFVYVGIENRIGWDQLRGTSDHSGLKYTSLLPRFMAHWVCSRAARRYRSDHNVGYRTYTYTHWGYKNLFQRAGLRIRSTHISLFGYDYPTELVALQGRAIRHYMRTRRRPASGLKKNAINAVKTVLAREWFWTAFGADFVFVLEAMDA